MGYIREQFEVFGGHLRPLLATVGIMPFTSPCEHIDIRVGTEERGDLVKCVACQRVISVHIAENLSCRLAKAFIQSIGHILIGSTDHVAHERAAFSNSIQCVIGAAAVANDVLQIGVLRPYVSTSLPTLAFWILV